MQRPSGSGTPFNYPKFPKEPTEIDPEQPPFVFGNRDIRPMSRRANWAWLTERPRSPSRLNRRPKRGGHWMPLSKEEQDLIDNMPSTSSGSPNWFPKLKIPREYIDRSPSEEEAFQAAEKAAREERRLRKRGKTPPSRTIVQSRPSVESQDSQGSEVDSSPPLTPLPTSPPKSILHKDEGGSKFTKVKTTSFLTLKDFALIGQNPESSSNPSTSRGSSSSAPDDDQVLQDIIIEPRIKKSVGFLLPDEDLTAAPEPLRAAQLRGKQMLVRWSHFNTHLGQYHKIFTKEFPHCIFVRILAYGPRVRLRSLSSGCALALVMDEKLFTTNPGVRSWFRTSNVSIPRDLIPDNPFIVLEDDVIVFGHLNN